MENKIENVPQVTLGEAKKIVSEWLRWARHFRIRANFGVVL